MAELQSVIDKLTLTYEGLFSVKDLYKLIDDWFSERGYDKNEIKNIEVVNPEGKHLELEIEPEKSITDYAKILIHLSITIENVKEVVITKDKTKVKMNQGRLTIVFDGYLKTDWEERWETRPVFFFIRTIFDKYIYKPYTSGYKNWVSKDVNELYDKIKAYLNLYSK
jgi:hypothetical protein